MVLFRADLRNKRSNLFASKGKVKNELKNIVIRWQACIIGYFNDMGGYNGNLFRYARSPRRSFYE